VHIFAVTLKFICSDKIYTNVLLFVGLSEKSRLQLTSDITKEKDNNSCKTAGKKS